MEGNIDRRRVLGVLAGAALSPLRLGSAEASVVGHEFFASSLKESQLEAQKSEAVNQLIDEFWKYPQIRDYVTKHYLGGAKDEKSARQALLGESRMFVPTSEKSEDVRQRNATALDALAKEIPVGKQGIFVDGDDQKLYLLRHLEPNRVQFIKGYSISTSYEGWSNEPQSGGTPIGLHRLAEERKGILGEIVAASKPNGNENTRLALKTGRKTETKLLVKSLVGTGKGVAEMITRRFLLVGPTTPPLRAINIHGTNRTNLLGKRGSGGCIRLSNVDVTDLSNFVEMGTLVRENGTDIRGGTPIMIQATWNKSRDEGQHEKEQRDQVPYQKRRNLFEEIN